MTPQKPKPRPSLVPRLIHLSARLLRPLTIGVRGVVLDEAGRVFLVRHSYIPGWHCPGGGVEVAETIVDALIREVREECDIEVLGTPKLHGIFFNSRVSRRDHVVVYVIRDFRVIGPRKPDREIVEAGFFDRGALPPETTPSTLARLSEILDGQPLPAIW